MVRSNPHVSRLAGTCVLGLLLTVSLPAQVLPPHPSLRILIVSDEVNPHGLPPEQLTQPGELRAALLGVPGLRLDVEPEAVWEVATDQIEDATSRLSRDPAASDAYDVLVYFAHRRPSGGPDPQARQEAFVAAVDDFLEAGGGVVSFHHGIYRTTGKQSMMETVLGGEATGAVTWNPTSGQNIIAVAPDHFVSGFGTTYPSVVDYEDPVHGIPLASYPMFNNTPDEQYPQLTLLPGRGAILPLFGSDFSAGGLSSHLLGWTHQRPSWSGIVVVYQPGEHQPQALEAGNNLQILLNAIVYAAQYADGEMRFGDGFETGDVSVWSSVVN